MVDGHIGRPGSKTELEILRFCLKCDKKFTAKGRFNRLCPECSRTVAEYDDMDKYCCHKSLDQS